MKFIVFALVLLFSGSVYAECAPPDGTAYSCSTERGSTEAALFTATVANPSADPTFAISTTAFGDLDCTCADTRFLTRFSCTSTFGNVAGSFGLRRFGPNGAKIVFTEAGIRARCIRQ